ncbi:MAG TPA: tRNA dihydrouridine synthase DusB [Clostridia bacterium]|nr:tRNA dihydrouridine synthase DusB [Clostridia bacterium]
MRIGHVVIPNRVFAAPMAGVTDKAFRILAKEQGCGLVYTEMVSAKGLVYRNERTMEMLDLAGEEKPLAVQLFGAEPEVVAEGAVMAEAAGASMIDINMGCPVPKVVKNGEGSALMQNPSLAGRIVVAVAKKVKVPVTVKIRAGWCRNTINAVDFAKAMVDAGAQAVTVHGRTRDQFYSGKADWDIIRQVAAAVHVPVIGNGDIWTPADGARMLEETGCTAIMIGRGALGNPWIFSRTIAYLEQGVLRPEPSPRERMDMALRHLELVVSFKGEVVGVREMRKHLAWYIKGMRGAARMREEVFSAKTVAEVKEIIARWQLD